MSSRAPATVFVERCERCGSRWAVERGYCVACGSTACGVEVLDGDGTIWAVTTMRHTAGAEKDETRHIGLVELAGGVRVMAVLGRAMSIGDPVRIHQEGRFAPIRAIDAV